MTADWTRAIDGLSAWHLLVQTALSDTATLGGIVVCLVAVSITLRLLRR